MLRGKRMTIVISRNRSLIDTVIPPFLETLDYQTVYQESRLFPGLPNSCGCCRWQAGRQWIKLNDQSTIVIKSFNLGCCRGNALEILHDIKAHALASSYDLRFVTVNGAGAKKYIFAFVASNESGAYLLTEPFYFSRRPGPSFDNFTRYDPPLFWILLAFALMPRRPGRFRSGRDVPRACPSPPGVPAGSWHGDRKRGCSPTSPCPSPWPCRPNR